MDYIVKNQQLFYHEQNMHLRREIRQIDLNLREFTKDPQFKIISDIDYSKFDFNFIVAGPSKSGKTSLLRTMYYALNSNLNCNQEVKEIEGVQIKKIDIKKWKKQVIEGLSKVKEGQQKYTVSGYQIESREQKVSIKYKQALEIFDNNLMSCSKMGYCENRYDANIKICIICLDINQEISYEENTYLKFFKADLQERNIRTIFVLTHLDSLNNINQVGRTILIDKKIQLLCKQYDIRDRDDVFCLQSYNFDKMDRQKQQSHRQKMSIFNYSDQSKHHFHNIEQINFYSLKLLQRIIKQSEAFIRIRVPKNKGWICGFNGF